MKRTSNHTTHTTNGRNHPPTHPLTNQSPAVNNDANRNTNPYTYTRMHTQHIQTSIKYTRVQHTISSKLSQKLVSFCVFHVLMYRSSIFSTSFASWERSPPQHTHQMIPSSQTSILIFRRNVKKKKKQKQSDNFDLFKPINTYRRGNKQKIRDRQNRFQFVETSKTPMTNKKIAVKNVSTPYTRYWYI